MCWAACCLLWFMPLIFMTQKAGYLLRNQGMSGIRLSKSSVQMLDIVALLLRMRRVNSALTLTFRKKSNLINGKSSLGDGWSNVPSPGSTIPDVSAKIMRFPSHLLRPWLKSPIPIPYSSAYEFSFLLLRTVLLDVLVASRHSARGSGVLGANQKNVPLEQVPLAGSLSLKGRQAEFYKYQSG